MYNEHIEREVKVHIIIEELIKIRFIFCLLICYKCKVIYDNYSEFLIIALEYLHQNPLMF